MTHVRTHGQRWLLSRYRDWKYLEVSSQMSIDCIWTNNKNNPIIIIGVIVIDCWPLRLLENDDKLLLIENPFVWDYYTWFHPNR